MIPKAKSETVVFITGCSHGIGLACVERFAKEGYKVIATARFPEQYPALTTLAKQFPSVVIKKLDVTDSEANIQTLIAEVGVVDILINNAAIGLVGVAESFSADQIQLIFNTNVLGVVKVTNAVLPGMRERNMGMILTLSSIVGPLPDMKQCFYSASKAAVEHYSAALRKDLEKTNIVVANIHPGPVVTNFEAATPAGERFKGQVNPYPQMDDNVAEWRALMKEGRPVEETVNTIFTVVQTEKPAFWNPTEKRVEDNFAAVYVDPTGNRFAQGPSFATSALAIKMPFFGDKQNVASSSTNLDLPNLGGHLNNGTNDYQKT